MIHTGLVSITFRKLSVEQIISLVVEAGLQGIEWGGDTHVPHGNVKRAAEVARLTKEAGLRVAAYGSYYRVGWDHAESGPFEQVLETAVSLEAPTIRVWAGKTGSQTADASIRNQVLEDSHRIAALAEKEGVTVSFEYHGGTLMDTTASAVRLLNESQHDNIRSLWQPPVDQNQALNLDSIEVISHWLSNLHVFYWISRERQALTEGRSDWMRYLQAASMVPGDRYALLEFVKNDQPEQFLQDAKTLKDMLQQLKN